MKLPDFLDVAARPPGLRCLIIGGYALAHHGHVRPTVDVDFLARRVDRPDWHARLAEAHMVLASGTSAFSQFNPVGEGEGLDLMWVDDPTFDAMERAGGVADFDGRPGRVVGLDHLLALKLHALRHASAERGSKDAAMSSGSCVAMGSRSMRATTRTGSFDRAAPPSMNRSNASFDAPEATGMGQPLNLPVAPGPCRPAQPMSMARYIQRNADLRRWFAHALPTPMQRLAAQCDVPFVLDPCLERPTAGTPRGSSQPLDDSSHERTRATPPPGPPGG